MRRAIIAAAGVSLLAAAAVALASSQYSVAFFRMQQGSTLQVDYQALSAATSACVIAPAGTTCTGGQNYTNGVLRSITLQNIGAASTWCDETSAAVASQGFLLTASGGAITLDKSLIGVALYCISTAGSTVVLVQEK